MRWLTGLVVAAFVAWGGYWFIGSAAMQRGAERWFAEAPARGLVAENTGLKVRGFPSRFDLTVEGVHIADPARGFDWQAPFAQVFMLSYKPWHMIAALPNEQSLTLPEGRFDIRSSRMTGSLVVVPGTDLALNRLRAEAAAPVITAPDGQVWQAAEAHLATERAGDGNAHRLGVEVTGLMLPAGVAAQTGMSAAVPLIRLDAVLGFTAPIDRHMRDTRPELAQVGLTAFRVEWGDVVLIASGRVEADAAGYADGEITLRVENWGTALTAAEAAGLVDAGTAQTLGRALTVMAGADGDPTSLDLPVRFRDGKATSGFIPLGRAPRLN